MFLIEICLLLGILLVLWKIRDNSKYSGYPPGPTRLPLLGNLLQIALQFTAYPPLIFRKLAAKYGDVMFIKMGMLDTVMISSHEAVSEVLQSDATVDRHLIPNLLDRNMFGNYGIIFASSEVWQTMRRFTIRSLREFGFGKSASMDDAINEEYDKFERLFRKLIKQGQGTVHIENLFDLPVVNVVWRLVTGKLYELDDTRMKTLLKLSHEYVRSTSVMDITLAYPALRRWLPELSGRNLQLKCVEKLKEFFKELALEHKESGSYNDPECFIDVFLAKMEEDKEAETVSHFNYDQLVYVLLDMFQAGSDTTSGSLGFSLVHMIRNPEIQKRVREEIKSVMSPESRVTAAIKSKYKNKECNNDQRNICLYYLEFEIHAIQSFYMLPYTCATILETLRYSTVVPFSGPREATRDVLIRGHKIKKGTPLTLNYEAVHRQKSVWGDPEVYRPERFLTSDGARINLKMAEYIVAFSGGRRVCLGQSLAETTLFIYFVNLMRHFEFRMVANQPVPTAKPKIGMTNCPKPFDVFVVETS